MSGLAAPIPAIILAGNRKHGDPLAEYLAIEHKCLAAVGGVPMIRRVAESLRQCPKIGKILVVANDVSSFANALDGIAHIRVLASAPSPSLSVIKAIEQTTEPNFPALLTTGDHALLNPAMIGEFMQGARGDLAVGLVEAGRVRKMAASSRRTFFRFRDGHFSGANLFLLHNSTCLELLRFWRGIEQQRKSPHKLISAFGVRTLLLYVLRRLTLDDAMAQASRRLGIEIKAVQLSDGRAAIDVDKPDDLKLVERLLSEGVI